MLIDDMFDTMSQSLSESKFRIYALLRVQWHSGDFAETAEREERKKNVRR